MSRNTEYQFLSTDTAALESLMIAAYEKLMGVSVKPASPDMLFIKWVASIILQERVKCNYVGNQNIPSRAEGENLDALGELFYVADRPDAQAAVCVMRFHISEAQGTAILVPAGTRVTDISATLYWETVQDAYIAIGDTYVDVQVRCQTVGTEGNGYAIGQINTIVDLYDYYSACENITVSDEGADRASDEEYYEIMRASMDAYSTAGAAGAYEYHAKKVSTEIADVKAVRPGDETRRTADLLTLDGKKYAFLGGDTMDVDTLHVFAHGSQSEAQMLADYVVTYENGLLTLEIAQGGALEDETQIDIEITRTGAGHVDIYVLMNDGTIASETIKDAVLAACSEETVRPLTDCVSVKDPETVGYNISFTYYIPSLSASNASAIQAAVDNAVNEYIEWQCAKLGRDINPSYLIGLLMKTGVKRVSLTSPNFITLRDGSNNTVPQLAVVGTVSAINGGQEDE